ncbi:MAG: GGDEF domain-containing protein [Thermoanaerobaculia bacterium]
MKTPLEIVPTPSRGPGDRETSRFEITRDPGSTADRFEGDDTSVTPRRRATDSGPEANIILISHPRGQKLGSRYRFRPGSTLVLGRAKDVDVSVPDASSLSRRHASLTYRIESVILEDLGSTNGTYVNDVRIEEPTLLRSGDRFQIGSVHFKFLQERDVENAYHQAIHEMVVKDGLTQISNRRKYEEEAVREVARARRYGRPLCLILFDVDGFKAVNDTHGHLCGDFVLKEIVYLVSDFFRKEQTFARVGGDEFAVLTPEARTEGAKILAERLRARIAKHEFSYAGTPFQVTCSFGISEFDPAMKGPQELFEAADRALYRAKKGGRNAVEAFSPPVRA